MRTRGDQPRCDRLVAVGLLHEAGAEAFERCRGRPSFAMRDEGRRHVLVDPRDMRCEAQGRIELVLERGGVGDHGELADALFPGRELERGAGCVAMHQHVVHRRGRVRTSSRRAPGDGAARRATDRPSRDSASASVLPTMPAPATWTSKEGIGGL